VCGKVDARQPVVITPQERERIDRLMPGSYSGAVRVGSTPELAAQNLYICPHVWCPKSRLSMSRAQFKAAGNKCPLHADGGEEPLLLDAKYWKGGDKFPGFLDPARHPAGLCMPCCFRREGHKLATCGAAPGPTPPTNPDSAGPPGSDDSGDASGAGGRYIRGDVFPLGKDVLGILPPDAHRALGNRKCGNRDDGSGQIVANTNCFVRRGVDVQAEQPFLSALAFLMRAPDLSSLIARIRASLTLELFVAMAGGAVCRAFLPPHGPPLHDAQALARFGRKVSTPASARDFMVFAAMERYSRSLADAKVVKTHYGLVDLFNLSRDLNPGGLNLAVLERGRPGELFGHAAHAPYRKDRPFAFFFKSGAFYEPVLKIFADGGRTRSVYLHSYDGSSAMRSVVDALQRASHAQLDWATRTSLGLLLRALEILGAPARMQVLDYRFRAVALITTDDLTVPLSAPAPLITEFAGASRLPPCYVSDLLDLRPKVRPQQAQAFFESSRS